MARNRCIVEPPSPWNALIWELDATAAESLVNAVTVNGGIAIPTVTRAGTSKGRFNSAGDFEAMPANTLLRNYDPVTLAVRGFVFDEQRENSITNNAGTGAVAGSPGTLPTGWAESGAGLGGLTRTIAVGTERGISYVEIRYVGTSAGGLINIVVGPTGGATVLNDVWALSTFLRLAGGSAANTSSWGLRADVNNSVPAYIGTIGLGIAGPVDAPLSQCRVGGTATVSFATAATLASKYIQCTAAAAAIDFTIRIGLSQWEKGDYISTPIPTTAGAIIRPIDAVDMALALVPGVNLATLGMFVEAYAAPGVGAADQYVMQLDNGTANERHAIVRQGATKLYSAASVDGGVVQANLAAGTWTDGALGKLALAVQANDFALHAGGTLRGTDSSITMPTPTTLRLGSFIGSGAFGGALKKARLFNIRPSNTENASMTA